MTPRAPARAFAFAQRISAWSVSAWLVSAWALPACRFHVAGSAPRASDGFITSDGFTPPDATLTGDLLGVDLFHPVDLARPIPDGAVPGFPGYPCNGPADCRNEFCVDGYCCDTSCDATQTINVCRACDVPGNQGHCTFLPAGVPSKNGHCPATAASTCGADGLCDGAGNCQDWPLGTVCGAPSCALTTLMQPSSCDGSGHCIVDTETASCGGYACASMSCQATCTSSAECATGVPCQNGLCGGKKSLGVSCGSDGDCSSGHCAQGVCCQSACSGKCESCAQAPARGLCLPIAAGSDPFNQCAATAPSTCGTDGTCDGRGNCRDWVAGTTCGGRTCQGDATVSASSCDGAGHCAAGLPSSCGNYSCNPADGSCYAAPCSGDSMCAQGDHCTNGVCQ